MARSTPNVSNELRSMLQEMIRDALSSAAEEEPTPQPTKGKAVAKPTPKKIPESESGNFKSLSAGLKWAAHRGGEDVIFTGATKGVSKAGNPMLLLNFISESTGKSYTIKVAAIFAAALLTAISE